MEFYKIKSLFLILILISLNQFSNAQSYKTNIKEISNIDSKVDNDLKRNKIGNEYLLGAGDSIYMNILSLPELSGQYGIGPDGMIYLPQIDGIYVNLDTIDELKLKILNAYKKILIEPNLTIQLSEMRPVRVFVKGEVKVPGFYNLSLSEENYTINSLADKTPTSAGDLRGLPLSQNNFLFPTLYDALRNANGLTPYSELSSITVIRNNSYSNGGGKIKTQLNFLSLFLYGDQSQNIRLFDGDTIIVNKSIESLRDQIIEVNNSNINRSFVNVYVSGKVPSGGEIKVPRGSGLVQAVELSGGKELVSGKIEFVRFMRNGKIDRRLISYKIDAPLDSQANPILEDGDIINIKDSLFGKSTEIMEKVLRPVGPILFIQSLLD
tara:strand:- start:2194 stop:3333 length:1140 start_codon:yes stop_codon:yes gene_type:complete